MNLLDPYTFYFDLPIYTPIKIDETNDNLSWELLNFSGSIDAYNSGLIENTTYSVSPCRHNNVSHFYQFGGMNYCALTCVRTGEEYYFYLYYDKQRKIFQKVGQFPSIADFHISQIKKYYKVLSKEKLREFTRAIGLAANGVGIGSFVYLRRIFEELIEEAHKKAKDDTGWDEERYLKQRMADKIELLKAHLPSFLVENKTLYSILSIGIHSLKEEDCLAYFETVKVGIEIILDEKVDEFNMQKKMKEAKQKLSALISKIPKN